MTKYICNYIWLPICLALLSNVTMASSLDDIKSRYKSVTTICANLALTKTSKYLTRPAVSDIMLSVKNGVIDWETRAPVQSLMTLDASDMTIDGKKLDAATQEKAKPLIATLRSLLTFDWKGIESAMDVTAVGLTLRGKPKTGSPLSVFQTIEFEFTAKLKPRTMTLTGSSERTVILFQTFHEGACPQ
ncbi:MAG: hypothetical protein WCO71_13525 [Pseudomonadota bacterium]